MHSDYGSENNGYPDFGKAPPENAGAQSETRPAPEYYGYDSGRPASEQGVSPVGASVTAPAGAPAERTDAPVPDKPVREVRKPSVSSRERVFSPRADDWSVPSYSQAQDTRSNMYTPGIQINHPYYRKHVVDAEPERKPRERDGRGGRAVAAVCLVLICVILSGAVTYGVMDYRFNRGDFTVVNQVVLGSTSSSAEQNGGLSSSVTTAGAEMPAEDIYAMACSQVVSIITDVESSDSIFGGTVNTVVSGSGFIISSDGYTLTNYHVIETAYMNNLPIKVSLIDGTEYYAEVIGYEENNDIAVIKIEAAGLNPAVIADSDRINVGQKVYAVGNPFGELVYTMTEGIVSARDREVSVEGKTINTFQFSAAVNSGNSGGPLYNTSGEVIGIVTAKPMRSSVEGIGFAIPINDALEIAAELIEYGYITGRPLMGITAQTVSAAHAEFYDWVVGAYVRSVSSESAAERAGMKVGDIIIKLGDADIDSMETLIFALRKFRAGDTTRLAVWRAGEVMELIITFDEDLTAGQPRLQQRQSEQTTPERQGTPAPWEQESSSETEAPRVTLAPIPQEPDVPDVPDGSDVPDGPEKWQAPESSESPDSPDTPDSTADTDSDPEAQERHATFVPLEPQEMQEEQSPEIP